MSVTSTAPSSGQGLHEGKLGVAGAGREVDEQHIEFAPLYVLDELLDGLHDHRAAPDDGRVVVDEEAHAHDFHAVAFEGHEGGSGAFTFDSGRPCRPIMSGTLGP